MFYLGGMTLGYLEPPPPVPKAMKTKRQAEVDVASTTLDKAACDAKVATFPKLQY